MRGRLWDYNPPPLSPLSIFTLNPFSPCLVLAERGYGHVWLARLVQPFEYSARLVLWSCPCVSICVWSSFIHCDFCKVNFNLDGNHKELFRDPRRPLSNGTPFNIPIFLNRPWNKKHLQRVQCRDYCVFLPLPLHLLFGARVQRLLSSSSKVRLLSWYQGSEHNAASLGSWISSSICQRDVLVLYMRELCNP